MKNINKVAFILITILFMTKVSSASPVAKTHYTIADALALKRIGQVVPSSNGNKVAITIYQVESNHEGKKWQYSLYLKNDTNKMLLLDKGKRISSVIWMLDDVRIAYLSPGSKYQSIWIVDTRNGTKHKFFEFSNDIQSFKFSPDGSYVAFTADDVKKSKPLALIDKSENYPRTRLYLFTLKSRLAVPITPYNYEITQFFVYPGFDWSPDSKSIVVGYKSPSSQFYSIENNKIGIIDLANYKIKTISYTETHSSGQPIYSPNGKWIAFQSSLSKPEILTKISSGTSKNPDQYLSYLTRISQICVFNTTSLKVNCLANTPNEYSTPLGWNQSSDHVLAFEAFYKTEGPKIFSLSLNPSESPKLISNTDGFIEPLTLSFNNEHTMLGLGYETVSHAPEAFVSQVYPFKLEQVTHFQTSQSLGNMENVHWKSSDGINIEGLLITPNDFDKRRKYPLFVIVHGGPAGAWSKRFIGNCEEFAEKIEPQTCWANLLSMGFIILEPNPRGSDGYGAAFRLANFADFGGGDYRDVIAGVDYLIQKGIADPEHLAIAGWSYGGYLAAWATSQTNRFKVAIDGDGNTDFISYEGTSSQPIFTQSYFGNDFWNDNKLYLDRSTVFYTKNIKTPILILHGENDLGQVPITQSQELYTALTLQNKNVKMFILPKQGHVPSDPDVIYESAKLISDWLKKAL